MPDDPHAVSLPRDIACSIVRAIIHDDDFVRGAKRAKLSHQSVEHRTNTGRLIERRYHDREGVLGHRRLLIVTHLLPIGACGMPPPLPQTIGHD